MTRAYVARSPFASVLAGLMLAGGAQIGGFLTAAPAAAQGFEVMEATIARMGGDVERVELPDLEACEIDAELEETDSAETETTTAGTAATEGAIAGHDKKAS